MKKLIAIIAFVALSSAAFAQLKVGHINTSELLEQMPEMQIAQDSLQTFNEEIQAQYLSMTNELQMKFEKYQQSVQEGKDKAILQIMEKEIQLLQKNIQDFEESANDNLSQKRETLMGPILERAEQAIKDVAADGKYNYILDSTKGGAVLYGADSNDITKAVMAKLGL
jgi:outer membrane protein